MSKQYDATFVMNCYRGTGTGVVSNAGWEAIATLVDYLHDIHNDIPGLHQRRCWNCGETHWHALDHGPLVACPECKSMDTRLIKKKAKP